MDSITTNFSELLAAFSSEDSVTILTAFFFTWLIGWLMRYFWDRSKIRALRSSLEKSEQEKIHFKGQWEKLKDQYALQEADLKKANLELADKTKNLEAADAEKRTLNSRLNATLVDLDKSREEFQETSSRMEDLNDQILGLRTKNSQMSIELEQKGAAAGQYAISQDTSQYDNLMSENTILKNSISDLKAKLSAEGTAGATVRITELESENEALKTQLAAAPTTTEGTSEKSPEVEDYVAEIAQLESGNEALNMSVHTLMTENEELLNSAEQITQYEAGNQVLQATITDLIEQNEALEQKLADKGNNQVEWAVGADGANLEDKEEETEELDVEAAKGKLRAAIGDQIAMASSEERDDLKQINGIGPFIEEKLNDLGIYTFEQVSQLDEEMVGTLTTAIEFFPGRIDRDDWVGQADRLFYTKGNTPQEMTNTTAKITTRRYATATEKIEVNGLAAVSRGSRVTSTKPDDLKKIEGIGPKISGILNEAGIYTFANLSQTPVDRLKGILADAGNRYKMHDPSSWPKQAALAAAGDWDELKKLQDYLDGGRDVAKG